MILTARCRKSTILHHTKNGRDETAEPVTEVVSRKARDPSSPSTSKSILLAKVARGIIFL